MYWQEESDNDQFVVPDNVLDLSFRIECKALPVDHAWALSKEIQRILPWFAEERLCGLHLIYGADSGNGWERPQGSDDTLYLSRRTRLQLRLPQARIDDAQALNGKTLHIQGMPLTIGSAKAHPLGITTTLYSRYVATDASNDEDQFLEQSLADLHRLRLRFKKILAGKEARFQGSDGPQSSRSLMVAGLSYEDAVTLQQHGVGPLRHRGFGLFVPHKTV